MTEGKFDSKKISHDEHPGDLSRIQVRLEASLFC